MSEKDNSKSLMSSMMSWIDRRFPVTENLERHLTKHPVPKKVNFYYLFGYLIYPADQTLQNHSKPLAGVLTNPSSRRAKIPLE